MVVSTFVRKTYLVLPKPIRIAVRFALPKREKVEKTNWVETMDQLGNAVFRNLWND